MKKSNASALMPILVFLILYLGFGIVFEYVMKIPMGFYNIPIIAAFIVAILVACMHNKGVAFDKNGNRIGYGGGYYDKYISKINDKCVKLALAYELQIVENIKSEIHDIKVDFIITNK